MNAVENVARAYARIAATDRPEVWIALRPQADALAEARAVDERVQTGDELPLAGLTMAVKDNIDVAGMDTTAACPSFAYRAGADAEAVARCRAAGAVVLGKTNMDQFATGLVGTRSPYGVVRDALRPEYVSGGSSSGSAVAVALAQVDLALATDTAGSGRVPASFQGIFGIKPTRALVPTLGMVPACPSLDCVSVLAGTLELAQAAAAVIYGAHAADPATRVWPPDAPVGAPPTPVIAVPGPRHLDALSPEARVAFDGACARLRETEAELVEIDLTPFLEAGSLLYEGAFVAERYAAVGPFLERRPADADPHVAAIIAAARSVPAHRLVSDRRRVAALRGAAARAMEGAHALLLPTTTSQPTVAEALADPEAVNHRLGRYTTFCNLFEMCALSLPAGSADGAHFGVTLYAPPFHDLVVGDIAARMTGTAPAPIPDRAPAVELFVVGAHLTGQPLSHQLTDRGGRLLRETRTAPRYRLYALATTPAKPGLCRVDGDEVGDDEVGPDEVGSDAPDGESILGELWALPVAGLGSLLAALPAPMALGRVELADGSAPIGFLCEPSALAEATEITDHGGWRAYLASCREAGVLNGSHDAVKHTGLL